MLQIPKRALQLLNRAAIGLSSSHAVSRQHSEPSKFPKINADHVLLELLKHLLCKHGLPGGTSAASAHCFTDWTFLPWYHPNFLSPFQALSTTYTRHLVDVSGLSSLTRTCFWSPTGDMWLIGSRWSPLDEIGGCVISSHIFSGSDRKGIEAERHSVEKVEVEEGLIFLKSDGRPRSKTDILAFFILGRWNRVPYRRLAELFQILKSVA